MASPSGPGGGPTVGGGGGGGGDSLIPDMYLDTMRNYLTPYIVAEQCFDKFFIHLDFMDAACFKYSLSKGLGIGIILGSLMVKIPQILKILGARSAAGITFLSVGLELFAITSNMSYSFVRGYPFSAWGEACFLAVQTAMVGMLVLWYNFGSGMFGLSFLVAYVAAVYALVSGMTPVDVLRNMQALTIPVIVISKFIQAYANFRNKSTGQLSAITIFMLLGGSVARIFTSIQETGDMTIIYTYLASTFVNALIAFQMLWYWNSAANKKTKSPSGGKKGGNAKANKIGNNKAQNSKVENGVSTPSRKSKRTKKD